MVEENPINRKHAVSLPVIAHHPIGIELGRSIGAAGLQGSVFILRRRRIPEEFTGGSLIKSDFDAAATDSFQKPG